MEQHGRRATDTCPFHEDREETIEENTDAIKVLTAEYNAQQARAKTWRIVGSLAAFFLSLFFAITGWFMKDTLSGIRDDIKELKTISQRGTIENGKYLILFEQMDRRLTQIEKEVDEFKFRR